MKGDFVPKFIGAVMRFGKDVYNTWQWETLYYKGIKVSGYDRKRAYAGFRNLEKRGIILSSSTGFKFTRKGRDWFHASLLRYHRQAGIQWDKKWRVVIFDIPRELNRERNRFRYRLKTIGFYMMQESVFVFPYPCETELAPYCKSLKIGDYVNIIVAESIGDIEDEARKIFNI